MSYETFDGIFLKNLRPEKNFPQIFLEPFPHKISKDSKSFTPTTETQVNFI